MSEPLIPELEVIAQDLSTITNKPIDECRHAVYTASLMAPVLTLKYRWACWLERLLTRQIDWLNRRLNRNGA